MPKPIDIPDIWASDTNYSVGPKSGLPTKTDTAFAIAAAAQGHIPGKDFPTTANEFNLWCFEISNVGVWVMEGTFLPDQTAHIVETDSDGEAELALAIIGGTTASGPSLTVLESTLGTGPSLLVRGVDDLVFKLESNTSAFDFVKAVEWTSDCNADPAVSPGQDYVFNMASIPDSPLEGPGGLQVKSSGNPVDTGGKFAATFSAENELGIAGLFLSSIIGSAGTLEANNTALQGVALFIGLRTPGPGMQGIQVLAGDGDPGATPVAGGLGISTVGGAGLDGTNDVGGGDGLFSRGGLAVSETPGRGAHIQSGGVGAVALELSHLVEPSQTSPLLFGNTGVNIGGGITMICEGSSHGARLESQAGSGLRLLKSPTAGTFLIGSHMYLEPHNSFPNVTQFDGDIFFMDISGIFDLRIKCNTTRFIPMLDNPIAYGFVEGGSGSASVVGVPVPIGTVSLAGQFEPSASLANVIIKVWCHVSGHVFTPPIVGAGTLFVEDDVLAVVIPAGTRTIDFEAASTRQYISYAFEYTIPAVGPRSFTLKLQLDDPLITNIIAGNVSMEVKSRWG